MCGSSVLCGPVWPHAVFSTPVCCSVFKEKHHGKTLKVKISVRRRWSWESLTPLGIAHCSPATLASTGLYHQDSRWRGEGAAGRGAAERKENSWWTPVIWKYVLEGHTQPRYPQYSGTRISFSLSGHYTHSNMQLQCIRHYEWWNKGFEWMGLIPVNMNIWREKMCLKRKKHSIDKLHL